MTIWVENVHSITHSECSLPWSEFSPDKTEAIVMRCREFMKREGKSVCPSLCPPCLLESVFLLFFAEHFCWTLSGSSDGVMRISCMVSFSLAWVYFRPDLGSGQHGKKLNHKASCNTISCKNSNMRRGQTSNPKGWLAYLVHPYASSLIARCIHALTIISIGIFF